MLYNTHTYGRRRRGEHDLFSDAGAAPHRGALMNVRNVHQREFRAGRAAVGALIDSLASPLDVLWPNHSWPRMEFDRPLSAGAAGGHGPIRYFVDAYMPGQSIRFRFTTPKGFNGFHGYDVIESASTVGLRHTLQMTTHGFAVLSWPLVFRPMHDALIEDSLATAQAALGQSSQLQPWSPRVRFLRWVISRGKARSQVIPNRRLQAHR